MSVQAVHLRNSSFGFTAIDASREKCLPPAMNWCVKWHHRFAVYGVLPSTVCWIVATVIGMYIGCTGFRRVINPTDDVILK